MSVSPDDLGRGLPRPGDDDVPGHVALPAAPARRRRAARAGTVAIVTTGAALTAGVAAAVPAVRDTVTEVVAGVMTAPNREPPSAAAPSAAPAPAHGPVRVLLDRAEAHLDAGRLEPASAALTAALRRLESVAPGERDQTDVVRYGALRARLLAALETGTGTPSGAPGARPSGAGAPTEKPARTAKHADKPKDEPTDRPTEKPRDKAADKHTKAGSVPPGGAQPSSEASAKPRA